MLKIENKIEFEDNLWVAEVSAAQFNSSQENRIKAVTDISSVCFGRLGLQTGDEDINKLQDYVGYIGKRRQHLYNRLLKESAGNPSTPFEFIPVKIAFNKCILLTMEIHKDIRYFYNKVIKYSYVTEEIEGVNYLLTNMRTLLKAGIKEEDIPFNTPEELEGFKVVIGKFPKVAFDHIIRSRALSPNAESSRNKKYLNEVEFHYPEYWDEATKEIYEDLDKDTVKHSFKMANDRCIIKPEDSTKELSCRRLILSVWGAWDIPDSWDNLFAVRGKGTGTQSITGLVVDNIKKLIYGK